MCVCVRAVCTATVRTDMTHGLIDSITTGMCHWGKILLRCLFPSHGVCRRVFGVFNHHKFQITGVSLRYRIHIYKLVQDIATRISTSSEICQIILCVCEFLNNWDIRSVFSPPPLSP